MPFELIEDPKDPKEPQEPQEPKKSRFEPLDKESRFEPLDEFPSFDDPVELRTATETMKPGDRIFFRGQPAVLTDRGRPGLPGVQFLPQEPETRGELRAEIGKLQKDLSERFKDTPGITRAKNPEDEEAFEGVEEGRKLVETTQELGIAGKLAEQATGAVKSLIPIPELPTSEEELFDLLRFGQDPGGTVLDRAMAPISELESQGNKVKDQVSNVLKIKEQAKKGALSKFFGKAISAPIEVVLGLPPGALPAIEDAIGQLAVSPQAQEIIRQTILSAPFTPSEFQEATGVFIAPEIAAGEIIPALVSRFPFLGKRFGLKDIGQELRNLVLTKKQKVPVSKEELKNFFIQGRESLDPKTFDRLINLPPDRAKEMLKEALGGKSVFIEERVARFGAGVAEGVKEGVKKEVKEIVPRLPAQVVGEDGMQYLNNKFPQVAQKVQAMKLPVDEKRFSEVVKGASAAGEEILLKQGTPEQAQAVAMQEFNKSSGSVRTFQPQKTPEQIKDDLQDTLDVAVENHVAQTESPVKNFDKPAKPMLTNRIDVSPTPGQPPKKLGQIQFDISKSLGKKISFSRRKRGISGSYYPGNSAIVIKNPGDLDTVAHELAHSLDDQFGLVAEWNEQGKISPFDEELESFWELGSTEKEGFKSSTFYKRGEGVAEYVRAWIVNPEKAVSEAPLFSRYFLSKIPPQTLQDLTTFSNDVRGFAGASAHNQIMANVDVEPEGSGIASWFSNGNTDPGPGFRMTYVDRLRKTFVDDLRAFEKASEWAQEQKGIEELIPKDDPILLARLQSGIHAKMDDIFDKGMINTLNQKVTPGGIEWLLEPLERSTQSELKEEMNQTVSLMIAQRTIEKGQQLGRRSNISGIGGGLFDDVTIAEKKLLEIENNPELARRTKEAAGRYRTWADSTLQYLRDKGRISPAQYDAIVANNEQYVAMQRVMETAPGEPIEVFEGTGKAIGKPKTPIKKFKGSARSIEDPYLSLMKSTYKAITEADRNEVMRVFRDLLVGKEREFGKGIAPDLASVGFTVEPNETGQDLIPVYVDGELEKWRFQPDIAKALKNIEGSEIVLPGMLTLLPKVMRSAIVNAPPFILRNMIKDTQQRVIVTDTESKLISDFKQRGPMDISDLKLFGGDQSGHYMRNKVDYARSMDTAIKDMVLRDDKSIIAIPSKIANLAKKWPKLAEASERLNRLAEYKSAFRKAKSQGMDDYNAGLFAAGKSRDLMDFAIMGNFVRVINQMVPFTSAAIRGMSRTIRGAKDHPGRFTAMWLATTMIPTMFERTYNAVKGDLQEYKQMPAYIRDMFWNFKIGPDMWMRIPKTYELGVLSSGVERMIDKAFGDQKAWDGYSGVLARNIMPVDESALGLSYGSFAEAIANYSFFKQKAIIPRHEEQLDLDLRDTSRASRLGKGLQKVIGVDARKTDFLMRELFGSFGGYVTKATDIGRKDKDISFLRDTGFILNSPAYNSRDVQWVMTHASRLNLYTTKEYQDIFKPALANYFDTPQGEAFAKDKAAESLRKTAEGIREIWEPNLEALKARQVAKMQRRKLR